MSSNSTMAESRGSRWWGMFHRNVKFGVTANWGKLWAADRGKTLAPNKHEVKNNIPVSLTHLQIHCHESRHLTL